SAQICRIQRHHAATPGLRAGREQRIGRMPECRPEHWSFPVFLFHRADFLMTAIITAIVLGFGAAGTGVVIDRVAITVGYDVVKDSDIVRDIRITSFLNGETPDFSQKSRRASANRLLDQMFIRREIEVGQYTAIPPESDVERLLAQIKKDRFGSEPAF